MAILTRRSVLRSSVGLAAAGAVASPFVANAAAKTAEVWWVQGFVKEEDSAFKKMVDDYEKASGNKIDQSLTPYAALRQDRPNREAPNAASISSSPSPYPVRTREAVTAAFSCCIDQYR